MRTHTRLADGAGTQRSTWSSYPEGWRWSAETDAAAAMQAVSAEELREHVAYWTTHAWRVPVLDLDGELRRSIPGIRKRLETERGKATALGPPGSDRRSRSRNSDALDYVFQLATGAANDEG